MKSTNEKTMSFFHQVYEIVALIPYGRVTSYGAIAQCLGMPSGARMVGWAMNHIHEALPHLPAHRVVNRQGRLTGRAHFGSHYPMEQRLMEEGIAVKNYKIVDFEQVFWNPMTDLDV